MVEQHSGNLASACGGAGRSRAAERASRLRGLVHGVQRLWQEHGGQRLGCRLFELGIHSFVLDGDNIRHGLNASPAMLMDFGERVRSAVRLGVLRTGPAGEHPADRCRGRTVRIGGIVTLTAFVSPYRRDRDAVRRLVESSGRPGDFVEVFVDTPLEICEARDPKGLYKKARAGQLSGMTGIDDPYEPPLRPELTLDGANRSPDDLAGQVIDWLRRGGQILG
jgi:adenylylsulfate kinase